MTRQLERAITIDAAREQPLLPAGAYLLAEALRGRQARTASTESPSAAASDGGDDDPEPAGSETSLTPADTSATCAAGAASADSPLWALLDAPRVEELLAEHPEALAGMELMAAGLLAGDLAGLLADTDPILDQLDACIVAALEQNDAFVGMAAVNLTRLARFTVRFVKAHLGHRRPYLRQFKTREDAPHEVELQRHFAGWLALYLPEQYLEVPKIGTGRSDVVTPFGGGHAFITEVKRELDDVTKAGLEAKYLAQAAKYQVARPPLGGLMTLDLTSHSGISPHLLDLVWIAHRKVDGGSVTRSVLCSVVLGNRPPPSQTR
jgi:hypothetical protein